MAKIGFTKLGLKKNDSIKTVEWNGQAIEVKQYLPIEEKLDLIANVMQASYQETNYSNPIKETVYYTLYMIEAYTNINFTDKQLADAPKIYDLIIGSDFYSTVFGAIPKEEREYVREGLNDTVEAFYKYRNSVLGILETVSQDYENLNLDATEIQEKLSDPNNLELLRGVLKNLG